MALGPKQMGEAILRNLQSKTGKSAEEWVDIVKEQNLSGKKETVDFLKKEKGLGHFQAVKVFEVFNNEDQYDDVENFIEQLFTDEKSMALFQHVKSKIQSIGDDIRVQPCKGYIPFYRKNQFVLITKAASGKVLIGINIQDDEMPSGFKDSCSVGSNRINCSTTLVSIDDYTPEVHKAVTKAYMNN